MSAFDLDFSEKLFFDSIKKKCNLVFDVGSSDHSLFFHEENLEVHYFEPFEDAINRVNQNSIKNKKFYINKVGLGDKNEILPYFAEGSLYNRGITNQHLTDCKVITGIGYCVEHDIKEIDFLKIDVEGMETKVLRGFGDMLKNVKCIQFEYGTGLRDAGSNLKEIMDLLLNYGFSKFYRQTNNGLQEINSSQDFWEWCNITTFNNELVLV